MARSCRALAPFLAATLGALAVLPLAAAAQTPMASVAVAKEPVRETTGDRGAAGVSPVNPWLSAQVAYRFSGAGDPAGSLLVSARALYWLDKVDDDGAPRGWGLPVMGNFTGLAASTPPDEIDQKVQELASSAQGIFAGVYPYWRFYKQSLVSPTVFAAVVPFKLNAIKASDGTTAMLYQGNASLGVEAAIGRKDGRNLLTVSATGTYALPYNHDTFSKALPGERFDRWSAEMTAVLPVASGLGLLVEGVFPRKADPGFRTGLLIAGQIGP